MIVQMLVDGRLREEVEHDQIPLPGETIAIDGEPLKVVRRDWRLARSRPLSDGKEISVALHLAPLSKQSTAHRPSKRKP